MKKIIALILATVMVMLAVASCGGLGTTKTTGATQGTTTEATTQATTTTEYVAPIPDPVDVVVYYPMGENPVAINISTNEPAGQLTLAEGAEFELVQGNFYVATYYNGESTAKAQLGAALKTSALCMGLSIIRSEASPYFDGSTAAKTWEEGKVSKPGGSWLKNVSMKNYSNNMYMDVAALNEAMGEYATLGHFGTLTVTEVVAGDIYFQSSNEAVGEIGASDMNVIFAYVAHDGSVIKTATSTEAKTPVANAVDLLRYANDIANGQEAGWTVAQWQGFVDWYGYNDPAKNPCNCEVCNGTIAMQSHWFNITNTNHVAVNYASALTNYGYIALDAAECKTAMDAAQAAFDTAIAANADIAAKKAAAEAEGATDEVKKAYTDALAADAVLTALNTALKTATTTYNNAVKGDENAETYTAKLNELTPKYEAFCAAYAEAANIVLWDAEDMENSYFYKQLTADGVDLATLKPTLTYYYDAVADTYTVYVTSMFNANVSTKLS